jgi:hypothetical protein
MRLCIVFAITVPSIINHIMRLHYGYFHEVPGVWSASMT